MAKGYPTPDEFSLTYTCRSVFIPDNPTFIALIGGQLFEATKPHFWMQDGTMSPEVAANYVAQALALYDAESECVMTCEQMIECIENDTDTRNALLQYLSEKGYGTGAGTSGTPTIYTQNPLLADGSVIAGCDNDNLFGAITQLVDLMNTTLVDIFQQIELKTSYIERTSLLVRGIPLVGALPIDEFVDFADQIIDAITVNYEAQYTATIRDEYRCDLFCLVRDTCELDFQTFADYFMSRVGAVISVENIQQSIEWFITGVWTGSQVVHAAHALICNFLAYGSQFFDLDMAWLSRVITSSMNDPDSDWQTLCEDCSEYPQLVIGWCVDATQVGTVTQESFNTWLVDFENEAPPNSTVIFSDTLGATFKILSIERITGNFEYYRKATTICVDSGDLFGWNNAINQVDVVGYLFSTDVQNGQFRITVSERGA